MPVQFIGMIQPHEVSETIPRKGPAVDPAYVRVFAQAHEHAGFDRILVPASSSSPDTLLTVNYAASVTDRIKFLLAHRPGFVAPTLAARQLATLDQLSGGRVSVNVITGGDGGDLQKDGDFLPHDERYERADEHYVRNHYASSYGNKYTYGKMDDNRYFSEQLYADLLAQYNHTWDDFSLNATLGTSMMQTRSNNVSLLYEQSKFVAPGNGGAYYPNIFNPSNFYKNGTTMGLERKRLNSVFGAVTFGFKEALFLDVTARNDWSSALAYTDGYSFFYPSVGASLLLNRFVDMGRNIDLFKFRGSYSIVGNDVPVYKTNPRYTYGDQGAINPPKSVPFRTLKPEKTHSFEVGFDGEFFQHRLHVNATYYKTNTKNQYFEVTLPWESGYKSQFVNAGNVQNQGFELTAGWFQDFGNEFTWSTDLNLSYNDNKIIELVEGLQDGLLGRPVEHRDGLVGGEILGGDLETAQVRRDEEDATARCLGRLDVLPAAHPDDPGDQVGLGAQQHPGQLERLLADFADCLFPQPCGVRGPQGLFEIAAQAPPVGGREGVGEPAGQHAKGLQQPEGQAGEEGEDEGRHQQELSAS